jgi:Protein of unknown function (DUF4087)
MRSLLLVCSLALACNHPSSAPAPPPASAPAAPSPLPARARPSASAAPPASPAPPARPSAVAEGAGFERRCGWVDNPTPANWWLVDRAATWEIGVQGGYQAEGDLPDFGNAWVETNGPHGYGCACMDVRVDRSAHRILVLRDVKVLPLARCEHDKSLPPAP